jgi:hypothetical protein
MPLKIRINESLWSRPPGKVFSCVRGPGDRKGDQDEKCGEKPHASKTSRQDLRKCRQISRTAQRAPVLGSVWWAGQDSNLQPDRYERPALTIELPARPERPRVKRKTRAVAMRSRMPGWTPASLRSGHRAISANNRIGQPYLAPGFAHHRWNARCFPQRSPVSSLSPPAVERPWAPPRSRPRARQCRAADPSPRRRCAPHRAR